jgi:hypothetical protein
MIVGTEGVDGELARENLGVAVLHRERDLIVNPLIHGMLHTLPPHEHAARTVFALPLVEGITTDRARARVNHLVPVEKAHG